MSANILSILSTLIASITSRVPSYFKAEPNEDPSQQLIAAACRGDAEKISVLLSKASLETREAMLTANECEALREAAYDGHHKTVATLLHAANLETREVMLQAKEHQALHWPTYFGYTKTVATLLGAASLETKKAMLSAENNRWALMHAEYHDHPDTVIELLLHAYLLNDNYTVYKQLLHELPKAKRARYHQRCLTRYHTELVSCLGIQIQWMNHYPIAAEVVAFMFAYDPVKGLVLEHYYNKTHQDRDQRVAFERRIEDKMRPSIANAHSSQKDTLAIEEKSPLFSQSMFYQRPTVSNQIPEKDWEPQPCTTM